jgi:hypothetical protein
MSQPRHGYDYAIAGVVRNTKYRSPESTPRPMFFLPFTQTTQYAPTGDQRLETGWLYAQSIQLHVAGTPESYENSLRQVLASINPDLSLDSVKSYSEQMAVRFRLDRNALLHRADAPTHGRRTVRAECQSWAEPFSFWLSALSSRGLFPHAVLRPLNPWRHCASSSGRIPRRYRFFQHERRRAL